MQSAPFPSAVSVRLAGTSDAEALRDLRLAWATEKRVDTDDTTFDRRFIEWLAHEEGRRLFWLAEVDARPVGMVNLTVFARMPYPSAAAFQGSWGYLGNLFVLPDHRGGEVGAHLIAECTAFADAHDFARVVLAPSVASVPLYERAGFTHATGLMIRITP